MIVIVIIIIIISFFCSFSVTPYNRRWDVIDSANYLRVCLCLRSVVEK